MPETLGELVRRRRAELGMSQAELGRRIGGVDRSYVSQIETGARKWPAQYAEALARELGVPFNDLADASAVERRRHDGGLEPPPPVDEDVEAIREEVLGMVRGIVRGEDLTVLRRVAALMPRRLPPTT